ncbi:hypothetical protein [Actinoplanes sp. N902-109]|uniref:hypothetical protein n=1 Tax=Actinoplanes sp. (strain N902-109) TaxID=649831 RepID=UPI000329592A|nr:hypothetical protein [Actinoplanes sp. N902-109]AGL17477.1 hypothetical protein L083_3967 [Actinoplanes sp. N902-109]
MAASQTGVRGLGSDELQAIRDGVAAGRKPRVMFTESAGQIAGQVGQVVALTDPAESDEWVVVRFGRDELPFAPADLQVAPKGPVKKAAAPPPPVPPARAEPEFVLGDPAPQQKPSLAPPAKSAATAAGSGAADSGAGVSGAGVSGAGAGGAGAPAPRKAAGRAAKPKPPAGLTVTLAYTEGEWTIAANQGAKSLAKPYVVRPAEAMRMVVLVDVPGVQEAVEQIVAAERAEAEQQAERLRAELAEIEARLQELRDAG